MSAPKISKARKAKIQSLGTVAGLARHIIEFDPTESATHAPWTLPQAAVMTRENLTPIPWPKKLAPSPAPLKPAPSQNAALPKADVLVVSWTVAEGSALSDVLTPGFECKTAWYRYAHDFASYASQIRPGAPASESKLLGSYFVTNIGTKRVVCFKSELHMSQDGPKLPVRALWKQIITETGASLVITTGTSGGIGAGVELGDVLLAAQVRFDCQKAFKNATFAQSAFTPSSISTAQFASASDLFKANAEKLPASSRPPTIFIKPAPTVRPLNIVTTDFFGFDTAENFYKLQGLGSAVEMGDAVLGLAIQDLGNAAPKWCALRNVSDPQIADEGTLSDQSKKAAQIYEKYGYWTTVCSAIAVWAAIAGH
jgi:purine-nucleoside phosphorylase